MNTRKRIIAGLTSGSAAIALALAAAAPLATSPVWLASPAEARGAPESFADLIDQVSPAVVQIATKREVAQAGDLQGGMPDIPEELRRSPFGDMFEKFFHEHGQEMMPQQPHSLGALGSGFIIDAEGYVVTNNHVVGGADQIRVTLKDGRSFDATLVGADDKTDLALLRIETKEKLPSVNWGDSNTTRVGDWVLAVGNPFGLSGTVTAGIVSARGRDIGAGPYDDFIQIDAPLNSGNSGGPLFDENGHVVGVNTAIYSPNGGNVGIGFAIPSDSAKVIVAELQEKGHVDRGWLGVAIQPVTSDVAESLGLKEPHGALVAQVMDSSPAAKAGIKTGDVILAYGGKPIDTVKDLTRDVAETPSGTERSIAVWRSGHTEQLQTTIAAAAADQPAQSTPAPPQHADAGLTVPELGLKLAPVDARARRQLGLADSVHGAVVVAVDDSKDAAEKGVRPGDLITRVNQEPVAGPKDVRKAVETAAKEARKTVLLMVERNQQSRFVAVELAKA